MNARSPIFRFILRSRFASCDEADLRNLTRRFRTYQRASIDVFIEQTDFAEEISRIEIGEDEFATLLVFKHDGH